MNTRFDPVISDLNSHLDEIDADHRAEMQQEIVTNRAKEIAADMLTADGFRHNAALYTVDDVVSYISTSDKVTQEFNTLLTRLMASDEVLTSRIEFKTFMLEQAAEIAEDLALQEFS